MISFKRTLQEKIEINEIFYVEIVKIEIKSIFDFFKRKKESKNVSYSINIFYKNKEINYLSDATLNIITRVLRVKIDKYKSFLISVDDIENAEKIEKVISNEGFKVNVNYYPFSEKEESIYLIHIS